MKRIIRDHPAIAEAMRIGFPERRAPSRICPKCREPLEYDDSVYLNYREVLGCKHCVQVKDAEDVWRDEE